MVLVDTCVWIDWLRGIRSTSTEILHQLLDEGEAALAPVILQELLQGAVSPSALRLLRRQFSVLPMLLPKPVESYSEAGSLYARCRWRGITPRSPHDCLIAQLAVEHKVQLLHGDRDFELLASIEPELRLLP